MDLRKQLDLLMTACTGQFNAAISIHGHQKAYAYRCVQAEYSMRYSESFLHACRINAERNKRLEWEQYFAAHMEEERGHHAWALSDLHIVNSLVSHSWEVSPALQLVLEYQTQMINEGHFLPQIGYCLCVESYQGSQLYWKFFSKNSHLPLSAFKNSLRHAALDVQHSADLWKMYSSLSTSEKNEVQVSAIRTAAAQLEIFRELRNSTPSCISLEILSPM